MSRTEGWRTNLAKPISEPQRIVSIAPSNTEILHALGLGRRVVGVDRWSDYPPRVRRLPKVGSDLRVDVNKVLALNPDVVVASLHVPGMEENLPLFERAGLPYVAVGGVGLAGVWEDVAVVGRVLGREARAATLVEDTRRSMDAVVAEYGGRKSRPTVHWEWSGKPHVAARRSWITELIEMAGGTNAYADLDVESAAVPMADAIARDPDVVIACWCGAPNPPTVQRIAGRPGWQQSKAVRTGRVATFHEALFGRPGPRLALGLEQLARFLHPEAGQV